MKAIVDVHEIVDANWRQPSDILDEVASGTLKLVLPTMMNLNKLSKRVTAAEAMALARDQKVVCVVPSWIEYADGTLVCIPVEAGYPTSAIQASLVRKA